jgi:hypothetical protein
MTEHEPQDTAAPTTEVKLLTIVYSRGRDLYRVAPYDAAKQMWLSVAKFPLPVPAASGPRLPYLGAILCPGGWRKAYSVDWSVIQPGLAATLPATDELVVDYAAAKANNP